jgi:hypothetical protein
MGNLSVGGDFVLPVCPEAVKPESGRKSTLASARECLKNAEK